MRVGKNHTDGGRAKEKKTLQTISYGLSMFFFLLSSSLSKECYENQLIIIWTDSVSIHAYVYVCWVELSWVELK